MMEKLRIPVGIAIYMNRPVGRLGLLLLIRGNHDGTRRSVLRPSTALAGQGHISREPMRMYTLFGDDVAYVGSSRSWDRTVSNMFVAHDIEHSPGVAGFDLGFDGLGRQAEAPA